MGIIKQYAQDNHEHDDVVIAMATVIWSHS
jgi:hypothetical protein